MQIIGLTLLASPLLFLLLVSMIFETPTEKPLPTAQRPAQPRPVPQEARSPYLERCVRAQVVRCPCAICSFERARESMRRA